MKHVAAGDARAFRILADEYTGPILTYVTRMMRNEAEAQDITQETFVKVWLHAGDYVPRARVSTWMFTMARNLAIDRLRSVKRRATNVEFDEERDADPSSDRPSRLLERKATSEQVLSAIDALPERQKSALLLCHEQGLSQVQIAEVLDTSVDAVESLLKRARTTLRHQLHTTFAEEKLVADRIPIHRLTEDE